MEVKEGKKKKSFTNSWLLKVQQLTVYSPRSHKPSLEA